MLEDVSWEFTVRKTLSSFDNLFKACVEDPDLALNVISSCVHSQKPYTLDAGVYFLLGIIQGILYCRRSGWEMTLGITIQSHQHLNLKPSDYIGMKRTRGNP